MFFYFLPTLRWFIYIYDQSSFFFNKSIQHSDNYDEETTTFSKKIALWAPSGRAVSL